MARQIDVRYIRMYTEGSVARKLDIAAPVKKATLPRAKKSKKIVLYVDPVAILGIVTAVVMLIVMAVSFQAFQDAQQELTVMEQYVDELRAENKALRMEYASGYDIQEVERTALALGMIPQEQASHVMLQVATPEAEPSGAWEQFYAFLTGLFA